MRSPRSRAGASTPRDAGFALAEAVMAGTLMLCLALPGYVMLRRTLGVVDSMQTRFAQNAQARQIASLLADGSLANPSGSSNRRGMPMVEGLHSRNALVSSDLPAGSALRSNYRFVLPDGATMSVLGDSTTLATIACRAALDPLPDCTGAGNKQVAGWIGADPVLAKIGTVASVTATVTSPYRAARANSAVAVGSEQYRMQFNLNVEVTP